MDGWWNPDRGGRPATGGLRASATASWAGLLAALSRPKLRIAGTVVVCLGGLAYYGVQIDEHYAITEWLVWRVALLWAYVALYTLACVGIGHAVLQRVLRLSDPPLLETWLFSMGLGLTVFVLSLYVLGSVGGLQPALAIGLPVLSVAGCQKRLGGLLRRTIAELRTPVASTLAETIVRRLATAGGLIAFAILYAIAFTPEAISYDAAWYHLPVAHDYARLGRIVPFPSDYNRALPQLASLVYAWGFLLPGIEHPFDWMMALHLEYSMVVWKAIGVSVGAQWVLGDVRRRGLWAGYFLFPLVFAFGHSVVGGAEHFGGFWSAPMMVATGRLLRDFDLRRCALLGIFAGAAILTKYQAIYMITACGGAIAVRWLWLVVHRGPEQRAIGWARMWRGPLLVIGIAALVAAPHFVKNAVFYGDPLYPFLQSAFPDTHPTHEHAQRLFSDMLGDPDNRPMERGADRIWHAIALFFEFSFSPHYASGIQRWPVFGCLFILLMPCALFVRDSRRIWFGIWCAFAVIAVWGNTYMTDRYLNAVVPVFAAVTVALLVRVWELGRPARIALVPLVGLQLAWNADAPVYSGNEQIAATMKLARSGWEGRLDPEQRYPYNAIFQKITAATPEDAQILLRAHQAVGIDRSVHRDVQWQQANFYYAPLRDAAELWQLYSDRGITHLLYKRDDHYAGTIQSSVLFAALVHRSKMPVQKFGGWQLVALSPAAPPASQPMNVAVFGLRRFYPDGLYQVEDLDVYGRMDRRKRERPKPRVALDDDVPATELIGRAEAIVLGDDEKLESDVRAKVSRDFQKVDALDGATIHLRRR